MLNIQQIRDLPGASVYDTDGSKIGQVYLDDQTGRPEWVAVHTGLFGMHESFVPLARAEMRSTEQVVVPVSKATVKDAPRIDPSGRQLSETEELELYRYYGLAAAPSEAAGGALGRDLSGPTTDDAMTRSEEHLRIGVEQREAGRVRLRKYVVTEEVSQPVPVERVRMSKDTVRDEKIVHGTVRKEQIAAEGVDEQGRPR